MTFHHYAPSLSLQAFDDVNNGLEYGLGSGRSGVPSSYMGPGSLDEGSAFSGTPCTTTLSYPFVSRINVIIPSFAYSLDRLCLFPPFFIYCVDGPHSRGQKLVSARSRPQSTTGTPNRGNTPRASTSNPSSRGGGNSRSRHSSVVGDPSSSNSNTLKKGSHSDPFTVLQPLSDGDLNKQPRAKTASSTMRGTGTPKGNAPVANIRAGGKAADMDLYN